MTDRIVSRPYPADSPQVCERCVFGRGEHQPWCCTLPPPNPQDVRYTFDPQAISDEHSKLQNLRQQGYQ